LSPEIGRKGEMSAASINKEVVGGMVMHACRGLKEGITGASQDDGPGWMAGRDSCNRREYRKLAVGRV